MFGFPKLFSWGKKVNVPTDLEILNTIYDLYHQDFVAYDSDESLRSTKIFVPIDNKLIAKKLGTNRDIIFGRLYYHLEEKYGYVRRDETKVPFYILKIGDDEKCINFPLMVSVLASLRQEHNKYITSTRISFLALVISGFSFLLHAFF